MNIWIVRTAEPIPTRSDQRPMRNYYLTEELVRRGNYVTWWTSSFDHYGKKWISTSDIQISISDNFRVKAMKGTGYKKNVSLRRILDQEIVGYKFMRAFEEDEKPDLIIADLPVASHAFWAARFAKKNNIPFMVDVRDMWPDEMYRHFHWLKPIGRLCFSRCYRQLKEIFSSASAITAVNTNMLLWGKSFCPQGSVCAEQVHYLGYLATNKQDEPQDTAFLKKIADLQNKFTVVFIGSLGTPHLPTTLVQCAKQLTDNPDIHFAVAGDGDYVDQIKDADVSCSNVSYLGFLNHSQIELLLQASNIGVCTAAPDGYLFPGKMFMYASKGLPVVSGFKGELMEKIAAEDVGGYYEAGNASALTEQIVQLFTDVERYKRQSNNIQKLYYAEFETEKIYASFADFVEHVYATHCDVVEDEGCLISQ